MDRREFVEVCALGGGSLAAALTQTAWAADAKPRSYGRVQLLDDVGKPLKASNLKPQTNYVFHYPFEATPVFLLDLGKPAAATQLQTRDKQSYQWPGASARAGVWSRSRPSARTSWCTRPRT